MKERQKKKKEIIITAQQTCSSARKIIIINKILSISIEKNMLETLRKGITKSCLLYSDKVIKGH